MCLSRYETSRAVSTSGKGDHSAVSCPDRAGEIDAMVNEILAFLSSCLE